MKSDADFLRAVAFRGVTEGDAARLFEIAERLEQAQQESTVTEDQEHAIETAD